MESIARPGGRTNVGLHAFIALACLARAAMTSNRVTTSSAAKRSGVAAATAAVSLRRIASIALSSDATHCASWPLSTTTPGGSMSTKPPPAATPTTSAPAGAGGVTAKTTRPWWVVTCPSAFCSALRSLASAAARWDLARRSSGDAPSLNPPWSSTHVLMASATSGRGAMAATMLRSGASSGGGTPFTATFSTVFLRREADAMKATIAASSSPPRDAYFSAL